jgi:hypothetical protein
VTNRYNLVKTDDVISQITIILHQDSYKTLKGKDVQVAKLMKQLKDQGLMDMYLVILDVFGLIQQIEMQLFPTFW